MDSKTWTDCYAKLTKAYNRQGDDDQARLYFDLLQNVPGPVMRLAVDNAIKGEEFFPNPAKLRDYCDGAHRDIQAPANSCSNCFGSTWVSANPIQAHGLTYANVVRRCPDCWTLKTQEVA